MTDSRFYLQADTGRWSDLFADEGALGCILVDANAAGHRYCFGTVDITLNEIGSGKPLHFVNAILNDPVHEESFDPFSKDSSVQAMTFEVMGNHFPIREMRKAGVLLQDIKVDVYWYVAGHEYSLDQAFLLLSGKLVEPTYDGERNVSSFRVEDLRLRGEKPFPPVVATQDKIGGLLDEHSGKPYPVVIGAVKKLPLLDISSGNWNDFLVMQDRSNEWGTPAQVDAIYDGDATNPPTENTESQSPDADGNTYVHVTTLVGTETRDVTADVRGHTPATLGETVRYLINSYGDDPNVFDLTSIDKLDLHMGNVTLGLAFNEQVNGGVLAAIRDRLGSVLPFGVVQRGSKYAFEPCMWDRDVVKHLRVGVNVTRKTMQPSETKKSALHNTFVVNYGRSGYRGDFTGCMLADPDTSNACRVSAERYGRTPPLVVDAGDLADESSARWLLNWLVETYSKTRVFVGYRCKLDCVNVRLLETVMVDDEDEWWDGVLFKVIGIRRGTGPWIDLNLVSVDDYSEVYQINRPASVEVLTPAAPPVDLEACWWEFDNTPPNDYIESQGEYGDDFDPTGDFTLLMLVEELNQDTNQHHGLMGRCIYGLGHPGGWEVSYFGETHGTWPGGIVFSAGKANSLGVALRLSGPGPMAVGRKVLIACMYTWVGDGNSIMRIVTHDAVNGKLFAQRNDGEAVGNTTLELQMGACQRWIRPAGRVYWQAMYNGTAFTDQDVLDVWNDDKHPIDDFNPTVLNYFCQDVAATYDADVANGPNAPYTFDVFGTPVKGP